MYILKSCNYLVKNKLYFTLLKKCFTQRYEQNFELIPLYKGFGYQW